MTRFPIASAVAIVLGAAAVVSSPGQTAAQTGPVAGMMGGACPMMGMMMGRGMSGQGFMGQGFMDQGFMDQGFMGRGMMGQRRGMMDPAMAAAVVAGRLAYLKSKLGITDAQTEVWNEYASAVKARVGAMQGVRESMAGTIRQGSATERMDARISGMETMVEALKAVKPATEKLYAALSDEQKKIADQLIGMDCGAM